MLSNYIKIAIRNLRRQMGYSAINVSGLAIGMACCLLIILYIQDELGYDQYHEHADRMYRVVDGGNATTPPALGPAMKESFAQIEGFTRFKPPFGVWMMRFEDRVFYESKVYWTDANVFDLFGFDLVQGNPASALRDPNSVVISESIARKYFGDQNAMGKILSADDGAMMVRVTGVMRDIPADTHFRPEMFFSIASMPGFYRSDVLESWDNMEFYTYVRLDEGTQPSDLESQIPLFMAKRYQQENYTGTVRLTPKLQPMTDIHLFSKLENEIGVNSDMAYIYILSSIALFMLIIACINFMNMATARSVRRAREVGLRKVVGASRGQLIRQFLGESILISLIALFLAAAAVQMLIPSFNDFTGKELVLSFGDGEILAWLVAIAMFAGVVAGSYPAFFLSSFQPGAVLKGSVTTGGAGTLLRKSLVILQFAISTILIIGTGVVYEQLEYVRTKRLGFDKEHVVTVPAAIQPIFDRFEALKSVLIEGEGIVAVSRSNTMPGRPGGIGMLPLMTVRPAGMDASTTVDIQYMVGDRDIISTLGLEVIAGRNFRSQGNLQVDDQNIVINERAVSRFGWDSADNAVGKQITLSNSDRLTVVGVVRDFHLRSLHSNIEPLVLAPLGGTHIAIRIRPERIAETMQFIDSAWRQVFVDYPLVYSFLDDDFEALYRVESRLSALFSAFSMMTILIACLGLLGLTSFTAEQRTKEIGIRKVLGASATKIVTLLSTEVVLLLIVSNVIAWPVAYLVMVNWHQGFAYHAEIQAATFLYGTLLTFLVAIVTVSYQSISAAWINPVESLRRG
ncbi:MAG: FtsX-like permease family protein [Candidatus Latescibacteria bacterium]|jgi:putative ABC transport system permease protein|nr:FtsX-like permease family protein [Candidatus Latescibacterota bacterium]